MAQEFIEQRDGGYYFIGSRVSLESVIYQFLAGESPEGILQAYPSLSLLQVYGGITYYLAHRAEMDEYLKRGEARFEELARAAREANCFFTPSSMRRSRRCLGRDAAKVSGGRKLQRKDRRWSAQTTKSWR